MSTDRLVVIGGDAAGMTAASQARRRSKDLQIVAMEKGRYVSYAACGIPYYVGGIVDGFERLLVRSPEEFRSKQSIDARVRHEVLQIRPQAGKVLVRDLDSHREYEEPYDQLLIATGASAVRPDLPGIDAQGIFGVSSVEQATELRDFLEHQKPKRAVIVGGGYIGLELAESFTRWGLDISIIGRAPRLLRSIDPEMSDLVSEAMTKMGIDLYLAEEVTAFEEQAGRVAAVVTEKRTLPADLVLLAMGFKPNTDLAREAGLALGIKDTIVTDDHMRTPLEHIWAAGDCVQANHLVDGRPYWTSLATISSKQGRVAGTNITGGDASFPGTLGTSITKAGPVEIARTGLQETDLADGDVAFTAAKIDSITQPGYMPDNEPMAVKLLAEKSTGRLLGGQIVGGAGAAMRINVIATALQAGLAVDQIHDLDLAYAPPFSTVWDPVVIAARKLCDQC